MHNPYAILAQSQNPDAIEEHTAGEYRTGVYKEQVFPWPFTYHIHIGLRFLNPTIHEQSPAIPSEQLVEG